MIKIFNKWNYNKKLFSSIKLNIIKIILKSISPLHVSIKKIKIPNYPKLN